MTDKELRDKLQECLNKLDHGNYKITVMVEHIRVTLVTLLKRVLEDEV